MKELDPFKKAISTHLQSLAEKDILFAETLKKPSKNINDCATYIINTVKKSGRQGFADEEIFGMAVHYYDEDNIDIGKSTSGKVVVNHSIQADTKVQPVTKVPEKKVEKKNPIKKQKSIIDQIPLFG